MLSALLKLASVGLPGIMQPVAGSSGSHTFTIRIPSDHPKADRLVKLFKFLETRVVMPSGIEITRPSPVGDPVGEFLGMLRDVVDDKESFDQALEQLLSENKANDLSSLGLSLGQPKVLAALLEAPFAKGFMGDRVEHLESKRWALNAAKKLRGRS